VGQKTRREGLDMFSYLKFFVEKTVEISDIRIGQCLKDHLVKLQPRISKYFPEWHSG
jgi:hypothetical protein